jgi:hypothetical protein
MGDVTHKSRSDTKEMREKITQTHGAKATIPASENRTNRFTV